MMSTHTPGPWNIRRGKHGTDVLGYDPKRGDIAVATIDRHDTEANARLIAAAPALLEALEDMLFAHAARGLLQECAHNKARAAIAQAKGV